jgi:hypothetical protein
LSLKGRKTYLAWAQKTEQNIRSVLDGLGPAGQKQLIEAMSVIVGLLQSTSAMV